MRMFSIAKIVLLAGAVALPMSISAASAKGKPPPGSCAFGKKFIATNTFCSFQCDDKTMWCAQQGCFNGVVTPALPCWGSFCTPKCGG